MEQLRTGRFTVLMIVFLLFGIMNPALAKLTPWLMETLSGTLAEAGVTFTSVTVDAMTSWTQFYKNIPMVLILFVLMTSGTFTAEYQKGTLIPVLTKGLKRGKVLAAKALAMLICGRSATPCAASSPTATPRFSGTTASRGICGSRRSCTTCSACGSSP